MKRYEDELYAALLDHVGDDPTWTFAREQRRSNAILGSTFLSWVLTYRRGDADVVHATDEKVTPAALLRRPAHLVVTCHGLIPMRYPSTIGDPTSRVQWSLIPRSMRRADRIIAISEFTKGEVVSLLGIDPERIDVVYHGIDHDRYRPMDRRACRRDLGLDADPTYILVVASTLEQKRMDIVTAAFSRLRERREDVRLLKAGYAEGMEGKGIVNTGWIPEADMPKLYNAADVYFHPSEYESFGFPVLEAMACGVPVVTSNAGSIPEVVGETGRMVDPHSPDAVERFAEALDAALEASGIDDEVLRRSQRFSWSNAAEEVIDVYRTCVQ